MKSIVASSIVFTVLVASPCAMPAQSLKQMRMTPSEIAATANATDGNQIGSSALKGVHTKVLFGNPGKPGYYSILLIVPAHTTIPAHSHRDDRMATVVSGEWRFGYGDRFDAKSLKNLPPGSVYSEPGRMNHFAQSGATLVIVEISGYGPTDTKYFDPANDPAAAKSHLSSFLAGHAQILTLLLPKERP